MKARILTVNDFISRAICDTWENIAINDVCDSQISPDVLEILEKIEDWSHHLGILTRNCGEEEWKNLIRPLHKEESEGALIFTFNELEYRVYHDEVVEYNPQGCTLEKYEDYTIIHMPYEAMYIIYVNKESLEKEIEKIRSTQQRRMTMNITKKMIEKQCEELGIEPGTYYIHKVSGDGQLGKDWARDAIECNWPDKDGSALIHSDPIERIEEIGQEDLHAGIIYWADGNPACFISSEQFFAEVYKFAMEGWPELEGEDLKEAISRVSQLDEELAYTGGPWRAIGTKEGSHNNSTLKEVIVFW